MYLIKSFRRYTLIAKINNPSSICCLYFIKFILFEFLDKYLNRDHGQHILVLRAKFNADGTPTVDGIGKMDWAANFWGNNKKPGHPANLIRRAFTRSFKESKFLGK